MGTTAKAPPITVEQFCGFEPPLGFRAELLDGEIVVSPEPKPIHQQVVANIFLKLYALLSEEYEVNMRTNFPFEQEHYMPSPDVFVMPLDEWEAAVEENRYPQGGPVLAVEVISPANTEERVRQKTRFYLEHGTVQVWNVYPFQRTVVVCDSTQQRERHEDESLVLPSPLPNMAVPIAPFSGCGGNEKPSSRSASIAPPAASETSYCIFPAAGPR